jgi:TonB family protein
LLESKLNDYYSLIWAKIKEGWTLPENLPKEKIELEAIIVVIIEKGGKVQKSWFEKKSGSALYDQMAMRAIKKAEPFPPIPKELSDDSLEIGFRFYPE